MIYYLSGPMTGIEGFNYEAFNTAAARLRSLGFDIINPAETAGGVTHLPQETFMSIDVGYVSACDGIIALPGWQQSQGAQLEMALGNALGKPVYPYNALTGIQDQISVLGMKLFCYQEEL